MNHGFKVLALDCGLLKGNDGGLCLLGKWMNECIYEGRDKKRTKEFLKMEKKPESWNLCWLTAHLLPVYN